MFFNYRSYCVFVCSLAIAGSLFVSGCKQIEDDSKKGNFLQAAYVDIPEVGTERDLQKEAELRKKAESGDVAAQFQLASYYYEFELKNWRKISEKDKNFFESESLKWLKSAAEHGSAAAQIKLFHIYKRLDSYFFNYVESARWLDMAVKQDDVQAIYELANNYTYRGGSLPDSHNFVIRVDYTKAADLYRRAAEMGHVEAQYKLGSFYHHLREYNYQLSDKYARLTWKERYSEAEKWYKLAISNGHEKAKSSLEELRELDKLHGQLAEDSFFIELLKCQRIDSRYDFVFEPPKDLRVEDFDPEFVPELERQNKYFGSFSDLTLEDCTEYIKHLKSAALSGYGLNQKENCKAQMILGYIYSGLLLADREIESMDWSERLLQATWCFCAADKNGFCKYDTSKLLPRLRELVYLCHRLQDESLDSEEKYCVAMGYLSYKNGFWEYDEEKAFKWLTEAARCGSIEAQCRLGDYYLSEKFLNTDLDSRIDKAEELYKMAVANEQEDLNERKFAEDRLKYLQKIKKLLAKKKDGTLTGDDEFALSEAGHHFGGIFSQEEALQLWEKAAEHGCTEAINRLIRLGDEAIFHYLHGYEECKIAEKYYRRAYECGSKEAKDKLSKVREEIAKYQKNLSKDEEGKRLSLCTKSWQGDTAGINSVFHISRSKSRKIDKVKEKCEGVNLLDKADGRTYQKLEAQLSQEAKRGDVEAQYKLGCLYYMWQEHLSDYPLSKYDFDYYGSNGKWEDFYLDKLKRFGSVSELGAKGQTEYYAALKWWREAAKQGHADAQCCLGLCYENRIGINPELKPSETQLEALYWLYKAASQGETYAQSAIGRFTVKHYYDAYGAFDYLELKDVDTTKIFQFCKQAAEKGDADAQDQLSVMYLYGVGTKQNLEEAKKWSQKAAEHRDYYPYSAYLYGLHKLGLDKY